MSGDDSVEELPVCTDGTTLPAADVLTGRGFLTGKSGSGKSNTCNVVVEELLERGFGLTIVDTDGEYVPLTDRYDVHHVGGDQFADEQVDPSDAERLAARTLTENVPLILDVSGYDEAAVSDDLVEGVVSELFALEKEHRKPYLLVVEELQEFLPQRGGGDDLATLLERVAKRGRKRGLGICGISQRPSAVDKEFVTQCDWIAWHRLTWQNDVDVVRRVLGPDRAATIQEFEPGEAFLMTDWDGEVRRVRFREKRTHDAGATPGLDRYGERPHGSAATDAADAAEADGATGTDGTADGDETTESEAADGAEPPGGLLDVTPTGDDGEPTAQTAPADGSSTEGTAGGAGSDGVHANANGAAAAAPTPPSRPADREGVAGTLLEFGALTRYLLQLTRYFLRVLRYRLHRRLFSGDRS